MAKWGASQVEFRTLWAEIKDRLESGDSLNTIYGAMRDAGRITMSRSAFYKIRNGMETAPGKGAAPRRARKAAALPAASPLRSKLSHQPPSAVVNSTMPSVERRLAQHAGEQGIWGSPSADAEPAVAPETTDLRLPPEEDSTDAQ